MYVLYFFSSHFNLKKNQIKTQFVFEILFKLEFHILIAKVIWVILSWKIKSFYISESYVNSWGSIARRSDH